MKFAPRGGIPRDRVPAGPLRKRHLRFAAEYSIDLNATQAARRAGYSPGSAPEMGSLLLKTRAVQAAIAARTQARFGRFAIDRERVLHHIACAAFADLALLYSPDGLLKNISEIDDDTLSAVAALDVEVTSRRRLLRVRRLDKLAALKLLGQHLGLFTERVEMVPVNGRHDDLDTLMAEGRARAP